MKDIDPLVRRFERIARQLPDDLLRGDSSIEEDVFADLMGGGDDRLLGYYAPAGIEAALEAYGIFDTLRARGYGSFAVEFDLQDYAHVLRVRADGLLVCECRLRRARGVEDPCFAEFQRHLVPDLLSVEWLSLADPRAQFGPDRPPLPGQDHPGSGIGDEVFVLLYITARRLGLQGVVDVPERFHNAVFYRRRTHFFDPAFEGRFQALQRLLDRHPLHAVAWALEEGRVVDARTGEPVVWAPREQVLCIDRELERYFELPAWRRARAQARQAIDPHLLPAD